MKDKDSAIMNFVLALMAAIVIVATVVAIYKALYSKDEIKPTPVTPTTQNAEAENKLSVSSTISLNNSEQEK